MIEINQYAGRVRGFGGTLVGLPPWARFVVGVFALPGVLLGVVAALAFLGALFLLLVLAGPAYLCMRRVVAVFEGASSDHPTGPGVTVSIPTDESRASSPGVKRVESTVVE